MNDFKIIYHLFELRHKNDLTVRGLAEISGVSKSEINDIENGRRHPTVYILYCLSTALGVPLLDMFTIVENGSCPL